MKHIIEEFYEAFNRLDAEAMVKCYHEDIHFEDPAFGVLKREQACNMWRMLCLAQAGEDFKVAYSDVQYNEGTGSARWEAWYTFGASKRNVHNIIDAKFKFEDGKIIEHIDTFDLYRWSRQALGIPGYIIGWSGLFKQRLNAQTNNLLAAFEKGQPAR